MWDTEVFPLPWLTSVPVLAQRYNAAAVVSQRADGVICVQAGDTLVEAEWLLGMAAQFPAIAGVVLQYAPSDAPGAWSGTVHPAVERSLADGGPVAGVRIPARGAADDLAGIPGVDDLCAGLAANGLVLELLLRPSQLPWAARLADRFPDLRMVLCHLGIGQDPIGAAWEADLARVARRPNVNAKISGILPLAGDSRHAGSPAEIVRAALTFFGADRLLFGSDWPMSIRTGLDYDGVLAAIDAELAGCTAVERDRIYGGTARAVYGLPAAPRLLAGLPGTIATLGTAAAQAAKD